MSGEEILTVLKQVAAGSDVIHSSVSASILKLTLTQQSGQEAPFAALTPRETEVLTELAKGVSNARIAVAFAWRHGLLKD